MKESDQRARRVLLRPLSRRRQGIADRKALIAALSRLDRRALGEDVLPQLRDVVSTARGRVAGNLHKNPDFARTWVAFTKALYESRRISTQQYIFFAASWIEGVHESRIFDGMYDE